LAVVDVVLVEVDVVVGGGGSTISR